MAIELDSGLRLESYPVCVICLGESGVTGSGLSLSKDHLIPHYACDAHPRVLKFLEAEYYNKVRIHRREHTRIDNAKEAAYNHHGLPGMVEYLALHYPRSEGVVEREKQYLQWIELFGKLHGKLEKICQRKGRRKLPFGWLVDEYTLARDLSGVYVERWKQGDFLDFSSKVKIWPIIPKPRSSRRRHAITAFSDLALSLRS